MQNGNDRAKKARKRKPRVIHISGKRWFQRTYGNTYHSYKIWIDGELVHYMDYDYGYGDQYLQGAWEWLAKNNLLWGQPERYSYGGIEAPHIYCKRKNITLVREVSDVEREKDL